MNETSKSLRRRYYHGNFITKYFKGNGIDVGCGNDPIARYTQMFPLITSMKNWDVADGDAQYLETVPDDAYDFLHASHSLEHMQDPRIALSNWIGVVKPGGYLIITVPDEDLYEHMHWPSRYSNEHYWSFTIFKEKSAMPKSINVIDLVREYSELVTCEKIELINDFYNTALPELDQTLTPNAECAIEIILKRNE